MLRTCFGLAAGKLYSSYGETGVMDFGLRRACTTLKLTALAVFYITLAAVYAVDTGAGKVETCDKEQSASCVAGFTYRMLEPWI